MKQFCVRGHDTFVVGRSTNGQCRACKVLSNMRWKRKNPSRVAAADRRVYLKNPEARKRRVHDYYERNKEARIAYIMAWRKRNYGVGWWANEAEEAV